MKTTIYLDHAATTPVHPAVTATFIKHLEKTYGNPSSIHAKGREARKWLDGARKNLARSIHAEQTEIIFTSGGTEADNIAIFGTAASMKSHGNHIITTNIEHHAVLNPCKQLETQGFDVTYLPVDENGQISPEQVEKALTDKTILVSIMYGNNEVGSIQPIKEIGALLKEHTTVFHTDAVQAYGVLPINVAELGVDLLSVSSHKVNGPKGLGFLYQRKGLETLPLIFGGEQERKRRAGTENVPGIVAFSEAVSIAQSTMEANAIKYESFAVTMTDVFDAEHIVFERNVDATIEHLPHILNISFPGTDIESLLVNLDIAGVEVSSGSACTAGSLNPSHVLTAMFGTGASQLRNSVRFSFGLHLTEEQVREAAERTATNIKRLVK